MKTTKTNPATIVRSLPHDVLLYIKMHYADGIIIDMVEGADTHGEVKHYDVNVEDADTIYHLRFNKNGRLIHQKEETGNTDTSESLHDPNIIEPKEHSAIEDVIDEI